VVGKQGPGYGDIYARAGSSDEVCLIDAAISGSARRSLKDWRDRTIASIPRESIKEIQFQYGDTAFTVTWRDSVWMIGREFADDAAVNILLGSLSNLQADEFLDAPPAKSRLVATIAFHDLQLKFSQAKRSEAFVIQSSSSPQLFQIQSWRAHQILKRKKDLLKAAS
jgi:hypothetical protein